MTADRYWIVVFLAVSCMLSWAWIYRTEKNMGRVRDDLRNLRQSQADRTMAEVVKATTLRKVGILNGDGK